MNNREETVEHLGSANIGGATRIVGGGRSIIIRHGLKGRVAEDHQELGDVQVDQSLM